MNECLTCELKETSKNDLQHLRGGRESRVNIGCQGRSRSNIASNGARMNQPQTSFTCVQNETRSLDWRVDFRSNERLEICMEVSVWSGKKMVCIYIE